MPAIAAVIPAILGLLSSLPKLIALGTTIWAWLVKMSGNDVAGFIDRSNTAFQMLNAAKTDAEITAAALEIQKLIKGTR